MKLLKHQVAPDGEWWNTWYLRGDRACGKTIACIEFARQEMQRGMPVLWIGNKRLQNYILNNLLNETMTYERMNDMVFFRNSGQGTIRFFGDTQKTDLLRGDMWGTVIWDDAENTPERQAQEISSIVQIGLRVGKKRTMYTSSGDVPTWLIPHLNRKNVAYTRGKIDDNIKNLAPSYVSAHLHI